MLQYWGNSYRFGGDPYRAQRSLIIHANGANGSTSVTDFSPSPATLTMSGSATISTSQSKFGGSSLSFLSSSAGSISFLAGSKLTFPSDFTIETWVYFPSVPSVYAAIFEARAAASAQQFALGFRTVSGVITPELYDGSNVLQQGAVTTQAWAHVAWVRSGSTLGTYVNKTLAGTNTLSGTLAPTGNTVFIGRLPYDNLNATFFIDELIVTKAALTPSQFAFDSPALDF